MIIKGEDSAEFCHDDTKVIQYTAKKRVEERKSLADVNARIEKRKEELEQESLKKQEELRNQMEAKIKAERDKKYSKLQKRIGKRENRRKN